jgi:hypothetical protein
LGRHACAQSAQEQIAALVAGAEAAIQKDARAGEAALTKGAKEHADALARSEQALQALHAAFQAAVEQEWGRVQAAGQRQAAFLKVPKEALSRAGQAVSVVACQNMTGSGVWHPVVAATYV